MTTFFVKAYLVYSFLALVLSTWPSSAGNIYVSFCLSWNCAKNLKCWIILSASRGCLYLNMFIMTIHVWQVQRTPNDVSQGSIVNPRDSLYRHFLRCFTWLPFQLIQPNSGPLSLRPADHTHHNLNGRCRFPWMAMNMKYWFKLKKSINFLAPWYVYIMLLVST